MEEVDIEVMQAYKIAKLFQTMAIVSLNMRNLNLELSSLKNRLAIEKKEKVVSQVELNKERDFQREYKHNINIQRKNRIENEQKIKAFIQKLQDENKELKAKTILMKSQVEKLQELRKTTKAWEATKKKLLETLFQYKQQNEVLGSQVEALTK